MFDLDLAEHLKILLTKVSFNLHVTVSVPTLLEFF